MKKKFTQLYKKGFSLIEVMIFITVLSIFFVTAISIAVNTLKSMQVNEHRIIATHYADELLEWFRSEKQGNWQAFVNHILAFTPSNTAPSSCLLFNDEDNTHDWWTTATTDCISTPTQILPPMNYKRKVIFWYDSVSSRINVSITVEWKEGSITNTVPVQTTYTPWQ